MSALDSRVRLAMSLCKWPYGSFSLVSPTFLAVLSCHDNLFIDTAEVALGLVAGTLI